MSQCTNGSTRTDVQSFKQQALKHTELSIGQEFGMTRYRPEDKKSEEALVHHPSDLLWGEPPVLGAGTVKGLGPSEALSLSKPGIHEGQPQAGCHRKRNSCDEEETLPWHPLEASAQRYPSEEAGNCMAGIPVQQSQGIKRTRCDEVSRPAKIARAGGVQMVGTYSTHCHEIEQLINARLPPLPAVQIFGRTIYLPPAPRGPATEEELQQLEELLQDSTDGEELEQLFDDSTDVEELLSSPIYWDGEVEAWRGFRT